MFWLFLFLISLLNNSFLITLAGPPGISFDDISVEDYSVVEQEPTKPDDVDNEVIQSLVDNFLNKGSPVDGHAPAADGKPPVEMEPLKLNKEAQALINSSDYWRTANLEPLGSISDPERAQKWLAGHSAELQRILQQIALSGWNYFTAASFTTKQQLDEAEEVGRAFLRASAQQSRQFNASTFAYSSPQRVQFSLLAQQGMNALEAADLHEFNRMQLAINQQFTHTQLCGQPGKAPVGGDKTSCLLKFPDLVSMYGSPNTDASQCLELWQKWRLSAGPNLTDSYAQLVELSNKGALLNGFPDAGAMWRAVYELPPQFGFYPKPQLDLRRQLDLLYAQVTPLYQQLHAYFRARVAAVHARRGNGDNQEAGKMTRDGPLPIHLLKSLNGESWTAYYEQTRPFGEAEEQKVIANELMDTFHGQNYTVRIMFSKVYRFMKYLGFERLPRSFWTNSIFTRNWSKDMICNPATPYDMMNGQDDYRIKVCGQLNEQDFVNSHRLMAKLFYQFGSRKQPILLKDAPNPSLSTALAGAFGIIALNPDYLRAHKLVSESSERTAPAEINRLYREALEDVVKLPFAIVADQWRFAVFEGKIGAANWSNEWWALRERYQGVRAPPNADALAIAQDAVASPAIAQLHAPATRDTLAYIVQFQILKKLCGGISQLSEGCMPNPAALKSIHEAIAKGGSISWLDAFEKLTGSRQLDVGPMLEYYAPLLEWLKNTNEVEQRVIGWANSKGEPFAETELPELRSQYESENSFGNGMMGSAAGGGAGGTGTTGSEGAPIAFPGQSCANGQECLLDSQCNSTICVCREGLYTLRIADSYNCVPGDPAKVGFTDDNGGLVIALNPNNDTSSSSGDSASRHQQNANSDQDQNAIAAVSRSQILYAPVWISIAVGLALIIP